MVKLTKYKFIILFELKIRKFLKCTCCLGSEMTIWSSSELKIKEASFCFAFDIHLQARFLLPSSIDQTSKGHHRVPPFPRARHVSKVLSDRPCVVGARVSSHHFVLDFRSYARGIYNQVNQESNSPHCNLSSHCFRHQRRCLQPSLAALRRLQHPHRQRASGC